MPADDAPNDDVMAAAAAPDRPVPGKRNVLLAAFVLAAVLGLAAFGYNLLAGQGPSQAPQPAEQAAAQDLPQLADYDSEVFIDGGNPINFSAIAAGRPLVVNFWATWCPYCLQELPDYQEIYDEYADRVSFAFVDATDGTRETVDMARSYIEENGYDLPVYYDIKRDAVADYGVSSFPTTVLVAADGSIMTISPGVIDPQLMRQALDTLLQG